MRSIVTCLVFATGCGDSVFDGVLPLDEMNAVPTSLVIDGEVVPVTVDLWRDFMPGSPGPSGLMAVVRLPAGSQLTVARIWVILDQEVWSAATRQVGGTTDWVARNGPEWGVRLEPTVVVLVVRGRMSALVRIPAVSIIQVV